MPFTVINADFSTMLTNYYKYNALPQPLQAYLDALNTPPASGNTPCCIQMSHALNAAGVTIPAEGKPQRRLGGNPNIMGGNGYYLLCVDELEDFLTGAAGATDYFEGNKVTRSQIKTMILGRQGILAFRSGGLGTYGFHTELWTGRQIVQSHGISGNMSEGSCFSQPRVLFWEVNWNNKDRSVPIWLQGWWEVYDGNYYYYYYFSDQPGAFYTSTKPSDPNMPPTLASPKNYATVEMNAHGPTLSWTQVDNSASTVETFTRLDWTSCTDMNGASNNFGPLYAKKIEQFSN